MPPVRKVPVKKVAAAPAQLPKNRRWLPLSIICLLFVCLGATYNFVTPYSTPTNLQERDGGAANPDEPAHMLYVQTLANGHLPVFHSDSPAYEDHQPPLYYASVVPVYLLFKNASAENLAHAVRLVNTLYGAVLVVLCFLTVKEVFPEREDLALASASIVAFLPMCASLAASVSNDTVTNLIFVLVLWLTVRWLRNGSQWLALSIGIGAAIGIGFWCKSSTLLVIAFVIAAMLLAIARKVIPLREGLLSLTSTLVTAALIALLWLIRNFHYYGDPMAENVIFHLLAARNVSPDLLIQQFGQRWYQERLIGWTFDSYWGVFDSMTLFLPPAYYMVIALFVVTALVSSAVTLTRTKLETVQQVFLLASTLFALVVLLAFVQYNHHFFQTQGRYLYPAILPFSLVAALGILNPISARIRPAAVVCVCLLMLALNVICLSTIYGHFSS